MGIVSGPSAPSPLDGATADRNRQEAQEAAVAPAEGACRFAFSTLGIPSRPLAEALELAAANGYSGVELRCHEEESIHTGLNRTARAAAANAFTDAGVAALTVASYIRIAGPRDAADIDAALREHVELAADLGAPFVRVFPGAGDDPPELGDERAVRRLAAIAPFAADRGVRVLLETHDSHRSAVAAARVLSRVDPRGTGAIWDTLHTHLAGDAPDVAARLLAPHLGYVQVKDIAGPEDRTPVALGAGALPLEEPCCSTERAGGGVLAPSKLSYAA